MRLQTFVGIGVSAVFGATACLRSAANVATPSLPEATNRLARLVTRWGRECSQVGPDGWGTSLCGPVVLVDPDTRVGVASRPDPDRVFTSAGEVYTGPVPVDLPLANTAFDWRGERWVMLVVSSVPSNPDDLLGLLAHESFHSIQLALGVPLRTPLNAHLEERDARIWLRLELAALAVAASEPPGAAREAAGDALLFRHVRHGQYPGADTLEAQLELSEGLAEYTRLLFLVDARKLPIDSLLGASRRRFERLPTFTRSLGYGTGPLLGVALDRFHPGWRRSVASLGSISATLAAAVSWSPPPDGAARAAMRRMRYGFMQIEAEEEARASRRAAQLASYRARLQEGPVLVLQQTRLGGAFNPNTVVPLGAAGTVYPQRTFVAEWGTLEVEDGGGLVSLDFRELRVAAPQSPVVGATGEVVGPGWRLHLEPGWRLEVGPRAGDWRVVRTPQVAFNMR